VKIPAIETIDNGCSCVLLYLFDTNSGLVCDLRGCDLGRSKTDIINVGSKEYGTPWKKGSLRTYRGKKNHST
jgi:hypothetical protein